MATTGPLMSLTGFLKSLTNVQSEGRILMTEDISIKFVLLNPSSQFCDLVSKCRAVIVAGGTMQPISEFRDQLFVESGADPARIRHFSCGHVVPKENVLPMVIQKGPSGAILDFSFQNRDERSLDELGRVLINLCNLIPAGFVVFFPSYKFENEAYGHWVKTGVLQRITQKGKRVYREPKKTSEMGQILRDYGKSAKQSGAVLLSVVGGKMSEGINFSDELGRSVVMVGLPFPNAKSPELKEKMDYLSANFPKEEDGRCQGQVHYENLCMKAVNQSIGRAIRHRADFASILLLDHRYARPTIQNQLPGWIHSEVTVQDKFGPVMSKLAKFYKK